MSQDLLLCPSILVSDPVLAGKRIAVVIPALNEERLLPATLQSLPSFVDAAVVVDDCSQDRTADIALTTPHTPPVVLCKHAHNRGVGAAIVTGYVWCLDNSIDIAVVVGADGQMHPDDMSSLLLPILQGDADYVTGNRLAWPQGWRAFPPVRLFGVLTLAALTRWSTGLSHIRDAQCGYTAITRRALQALPLARIYPRYGFPNDLLSWVALCRLRTVDRPVRPIYAGEESKLRVRRVIGPLLRISLENRWRRVLQQQRSAYTTPAGAETVVVHAEPSSSSSSHHGA